MFSRILFPIFLIGAVGIPMVVLTEGGHLNPGKWLNSLAENSTEMAETDSAAYLVLMLSISVLVLLSQDDQPSQSGRGRLKNWSTNLVILLPAAVAVADVVENLFIYALLRKFEPLGTGFIFGMAAVGVGILASRRA